MDGVEPRAGRVQEDSEHGEPKRRTGGAFFGEGFGPPQKEATLRRSDGCSGWEDGGKKILPSAEVVFVPFR